MNKKNLIYIGILVVVVLGVMYMRSDRDTRRINKRLDDLRETIEKDAGQSNIRAIGKARSVPNYFTEDAVIDLQPVLPSRISRGDLSAIFMQVHTHIERLDIRIHDRQLEIDRDARTADMQFTARGNVRAGGGSDSQVHTFRMNWVHDEGDWHIQRVEIQQTIRSPRSPDN